VTSPTLVGRLQRSVGNPIVTAILRSPLHQLLSRRVVLITVVGRRTGRRYIIPVGYVRQDGTLDVLVADRDLKVWWRNLVGGAPVELLLDGRIIPARAEALTFERNKRAFIVALRNYVAGNRRGAQAVGIRDVEDVPGLRFAADVVAMVRIYLPAARSAMGGTSTSDRART
jgi:F420H(2)-dependent quinone reductase